MHYFFTMHQPSRRTFLRNTSAATALLAMGCLGKENAPSSPTVFPEDIEKQNSLVDANQVASSMDAMAISLSQATDASAAWQTIFRKPADKEWVDVKAAVKYNEVGYNPTRIAIIDKISRELHALGIPCAHIRVYGGANTGNTQYTNLMKQTLPAGVVISAHDAELGGTSSVTIPPASNDKDSVTSASCIKEIAEKQNDILVNIAVNKAHDDEFGGFTMAMKNHFGTFDPKPFPGAAFNDIHANFSYLLAINQSDALVGGEIPQQQLCIVDSIWAGAGSHPGEPGEDSPRNLLAMGTFAPALDYAVAIHHRKEVMGCTVSENAAKILPAFDYSEQDIALLEWVDAVASKRLSSSKSGHSSNTFEIHPSIPNLRVAYAHNPQIVKV